jgi:hypothetical protein
MERVTRALMHWLAKNNIPYDGVRLIVEFPEDRYVHAAQACITRDLQPIMMQYTKPFGEIETMNGIKLSLRAVDKRTSDR